MKDKSQNHINNNMKTWQDWRHAVEIFVSTNCSQFDNVSIPGGSTISSTSSKSSKLPVPESQASYSTQQYVTWKKFQEVVEQILNTFLESLGGSIEKLEKALDEISSQSM